MSTAKAVLHIGLHKTGTTSIQWFLWSNKARLASAGVEFYSGIHWGSNHMELQVATLRPDRRSPFRLMTGEQPNERYLGIVKTNVSRFVQEASSPLLVFSTEGLSYLRYPDEMRRLQDLLALQDIKVIVYLRNLHDWRSSYSAEMEAIKLRGGSDSAEFFDMTEDSWLLNFDQRVDAFRDAFGSENVTVISYDDVTKRDGTVVPSFLEAIDVRHKFESDEWKDFWLNSRAAKATGTKSLAMPPNLTY